MELPLSPAIVRALLVLCLLGMEVLSAAFLCQRRMTFWQYVRWGMLAVLLPVLGPFLVILLRPGRPAIKYGRSSRRFRQNKLTRLFISFSNRLLKKVI